MSEDYATAEEILREALTRVRHERKSQAEYMVEVRDQLAYAEEMHRQAVVAEAALDQLLNSQAFQFNERALAQIAEIEAEAEAVPAAVLEPAAPPLLIDYTDIPAALLEPPAEPEPVEREPVQPEPEPAPPPPPQERPHPKTPEGANLAAADEDRAFAALKRVAGGKPEIQVSLAIVSDESNVPKGSILFVLRRLADAGRIEIVPDLSAQGTKRPNTYRFVGAVAVAVAAALPAAPPKIVSIAPAFKAPATVTKASSLRDRIAHALSKYEGTTSGLASMLDVKELLICQTLTAMEHEGVVVGGPMPEAGRRAQLWAMSKGSI